jgi:hypothetical protein
VTGEAARSRWGRWRSLEAAAVAGVLHSVLSLVATFLLLDSVDPDDGDAAVAAYLSDEANQSRALLALNLLALSSIAFLWFVAVIRRRVGERESRFFGTVFFGSGLLVTVTWITAGVLYAAPALAARSFDSVATSDTVAVLQSAGLAMASVMGSRVEAVFVVSTTTVGRLSGAFPRWLVGLGYALGLVLLLFPVPNDLGTYLFPCWVLLVSLMMLLRRDEIEQRDPTSAR